jgi:hypothetical protein
VMAVPLPLMVRVYGDPVNESTGRTLSADQDSDRVRTGERDHAAAAPDLQVADGALEGRRCRERIGWKRRRPAAIQRVDEKPHVVGPAEAIRRHFSSI